MSYHEPPDEPADPQHNCSGCGESCSVVDARDHRDCALIASIMQDVCDTEPADADDPQSVIINQDKLTGIVASALADERSATDDALNAIWQIVYPGKTDWDYPGMVWRHVKMFTEEQAARIARLTEENSSLRAERDRLAERVSVLELLSVGSQLDLPPDERAIIYGNLWDLYDADGGRHPRGGEVKRRVVHYEWGGSPICGAKVTDTTRLTDFEEVFTCHRCERTIGAQEIPASPNSSGASESAMNDTRRGADWETAIRPAHTGVALPEEGNDGE